MLSIAPLTRKGCAMATKEIDGLLQFKDKNGDVNIVYPVTKAENVEGLFGENGKIPSDQLPDMDYLPLAGGTMTGNISFTYTGELNDTERTVDIGGLVLSGGMGGSYINLGNGITTITSDLSETALAVGLMENNVQDAIGFIISNSSAMNQMYGTTTGINTTSDINMSGHSITNLKDPASDGDAVNKKFVDKSKPTYVSDTMRASKWDKSSKTYSFESSYPFASYDIEIQPSDACTELQFEAWSKSRIVGSISKNIAKAIGDVPTVDIPIILKAVKK